MHKRLSLNSIFAKLHHLDWSMEAPKRWGASARRTSAARIVAGPQHVGESDFFLDALIDAGRSRRVLAGSDFPIGLPSAYGLLTGASGFV